MTEGGASKMKRSLARLFKNPPQPHMCIQDFIQGTTAPCYVNVLSWEKIGMPCKPSQTVPLYGGMRVRSPRTKKEAIVFAVMVNPEVLRVNGKNAQDPKKRSTLIEHLLDFVESMNAGVIFARQYTILKDRDITGELKEVWNAVQAKRDREQPPLQLETWIDAQPPVPQYPQYQDQPQEYTSQPPQYHSSIAYGRAIGSDGMHYDGYSHQPPSPVIPQNDQLYQTGQIIPQQYHGNVPRIPQDRYNYRERGRENMMQNIPQQSCPAYPGPQYQFQQLPRQMVPQYVNSNVHPNAALGYCPPANANVNPAMNANLGGPFQPYITYQQPIDNTMHVDMRRMQPQQQQMHMNHVQVPQYEPAAMNVQTGPSKNAGKFRPHMGMAQKYDVQVPQYEQAAMNVQTGPSKNAGNFRPHMGMAQKYNAMKRQINSPTHSKQPSCTNCQNKDGPADTGAKPKSPVKVLQRELPLAERQEANNHAPTANSKPAEKIVVEETKNVQVTDLDEDIKKGGESDAENQESSNKPNDTQPSESGLTIASRELSNSVEEVTTTDDKQETKAVDVPNGQTSPEQKNAKPQVIVINLNKHKENTENNRTFRIRFVSDQKADNPKPSPTVNSIIKSVFKIHPNMSGEKASGKRKTNGQVKINIKMAGNEETQQGYTILKKSESNVQEEVVNELAQLSIQDCNDASEVSPVLS